MKKLLLTIALTLTAAFANAALAPLVESKTYGIHLYFDETEFIDVLIVNKFADGAIKGEMQVPNDFTGVIQNVKIAGQKITFDLLVPKNLSRPTDLMFHYEGQFFDATQTQLIGFVNIRDQPGFVASFTGFLRN